MATNVGIAINGGGRSQFNFSVGTVALLTVNAGDHRQLAIDECTSTSIKMGGADQNFPQVMVNEGSTTVGQVALAIEVINDPVTSCFIRVPGDSQDRAVLAGGHETFIFVNLGFQPAFQGSAILEWKYEVKHQDLKSSPKRSDK